MDKKGLCNRRSNSFRRLFLALILFAVGFMPFYSPSANAVARSDENASITGELVGLGKQTNLALPKNNSNYIYKYLIHRNTGGPVACNDTLFPVYVGKRTGNVKKDVSIALKSLFLTSASSGGLYYPLASSKLKVGGVEYNPKNSNLTIRLNGRLVRTDNYCDTARARAVVWATAQQFPEVRHAKITLGSALLGDLLAAKERAKP